MTDHNQTMAVDATTNGHATADITALVEAAHATDAADTIDIANDGFRLTDVGNAARLVKLAEGRIRYVHKWGKWLVYRDGRWIVDSSNALMTEIAKEVPRSLLRLMVHEAGDGRDRLFKWAKQSEKAATIGAMVQLARGDERVIVDHEELDADPYLLNVRNGTVDLRTGEHRPHSPDDLMTMQAPVDYDPDATAPLWDACLERWQPDPETRRFLQAEAGAGATGRPTETLSIHHGGGGNGKTKFFEALRHVLGEYTCAPHKSLLIVQKHDQHATVVASLFRKRLAVASETDASDRISEAQVKNLTGGDRLRVRRMREDEWEFNPTHTLVMFSNHKPSIRGRDEGIWRRVRLVPWTVQIPEGEKDESLDIKLQAEASGILRWVVEGARLYLNEGVKPPAAVQVATANFRNSEDHLGRFVSEALRIGEGFTTTAVIQTELEDWCAGQGIPAISLVDLAAVLKDAGCQSGRRTIKGQKRTVWTGVSINDQQQMDLP